MNAKSVKSALIASAVCAMFATAAQAADKGHDKAGGDVKCAGINSCKGSGSCAGASNGCSGQNGCKGKGWTATKSEKECTDKGGKVVVASKK